MPACNIRNIDADLMRTMKTIAASEGLSLREWCIKVFQKETIGAATVWKNFEVDATDAAETLREAFPFKYTIGSLDLPKARKPTAKTSGAHNVKTCRVYRCAQCLALGKSF